MTEDLGERLWRGSGAEQALESLDMRALRHTLLTTLPTPRLARCAFRVELSDGRTVKVRRLLLESRVDEVYAIRQQLSRQFAPILHRVGPVLIEEWVEGQSLGEDSSAYLGAAAALLRTLHQQQSVQAGDCAVYLQELEAGLSLLETSQELSHRQTSALRELALASAPERVGETLIHTDFCADNLILTAGQELVVIDNEALRLGPVEFDLARVLYRWPMGEESWKLFLDHYGAADPSPFWHVLARTRGAVARISHQMPLVAEATIRLCELLD